MPSSAPLPSSCEWQRTYIRLAAQQKNACGDEDMSEDYYLHLPVFESSQHSNRRRMAQLMTLDRYLASSVPQLTFSTQQLLSTPSAAHSNNRSHTNYHDNARYYHKVITSSNSGRVINLLQGEIAHCTPTQADLLVSDDATTCHILALWSRRVVCYTSVDYSHQLLQQQYQRNLGGARKHHDGGSDNSDEAVIALASMAHIDSPGYHESLRNAINLHYQYHSSQVLLSSCRHHSETSTHATTPNIASTAITTIASIDCSSNKKEQGWKEARNHNEDGGNDVLMNAWRDAHDSDDEEEEVHGSQPLLNDDDIIDGNHWNNSTTCNDNNYQPHDPFIIEVSIHLMGGYNDDDGASIEITDDVLRTLSNISEEYIDSERGHTTPQVLLQMTLQTCAVSSANDNGNGCPIGRGLALNVSSGKVYLAEVEEGVESSFPHRDNNTPLTTSAQGPNIVLRSSRIWASTFYNNRTSNSSNNNKRLHIIHTPNEDHLSISPFFFAPHPYAYYLLSLNDDQLIQLTSTSPEVEKGNFVRNVRKSLSYINGTRSRYVFKKKKTAIGAGCDDDDDDDDDDDGENLPLRYRREGLNGWVAV